MPRIVFTISDETRGLLNEYGQDFNVSGLCRRALEAELSRRQAAKKADGAKLADRLTVEMQEDLEAKAFVGSSDGMEWAEEHGTYELLSDLASGRIGECRQEMDKIAEAYWNDRFDKAIKVPALWDSYVLGFCGGAIQAFVKAFEGNRMLKDAIDNYTAAVWTYIDEGERSAGDDGP